MIEPKQEEEEKDPSSLANVNPLTSPEKENGTNLIGSVDDKMVVTHVGSENRPVRQPFTEI